MQQSTSRIVLIGCLYVNCQSLLRSRMGLVMDISDRVVVLDFGTKIADSTPDAVRADGRVIQVYLGSAG